MSEPFVSRVSEDVAIASERIGSSRATRPSVSALVDRLPLHADRVDLTPEQARTVASELVREADRIEGERDD
ncbi:MAG: DUF6360 family protein [Halorubrum sp.]|uniref:hypothetical protein n=1 Tax=Halorubrum sp. TaxID=1879286 RepID=UPI003970B2DF